MDRAKDPKDFIKRGEDSAIIEIELYKARNNSNLKIRREISKKGGKWYIDGNLVKKEEISKIVKDLNIQIDNLCQFLPQERVVEFAKLTPQNLLRETEKAVGGEEFLKVHEKLINLKQTRLEHDKSVGQRKKVLEDLVKKNQSCKAEVERFKERESLRAKLKLLHQKKPWLEFEEERKNAAVLKEKQKKAIEVRKKAEKKKRTFETEKRCTC